MFAVRSEALLHFYRRLRISSISKVSIIKLRHYSREWNEWKRSDERTLYLLRNERRAVLTTGATLLVGFVALLGAKMYSSANASGSADCRPLVLAGPSGSGKSTLLKRLFAEFPGELGFSVSRAYGLVNSSKMSVGRGESLLTFLVMVGCGLSAANKLLQITINDTTRKPREGEKNGREYHFVTREEMQSKIDGGHFIEYAVFSGNMYGTSKQSVKDVATQGRICVLDIDMQGVRSLKKTDLNPVYVLIKPPSLQILEERLRGRGTDSAESIEKRLKTAEQELEFGNTPGVFDHMITNDTLDDAYEQLKKIFINEIKSVGSGGQIMTYSSP